MNENGFFSWRDCRNDGPNLLPKSLAQAKVCREVSAMIARGLEVASHNDEPSYLSFPDDNFRFFFKVRGYEACSHKSVIQNRVEEHVHERSKETTADIFPFFFPFTFQERLECCEAEAYDPFLGPSGSNRM